MLRAAGLQQRLLGRGAAAGGTIRADVSRSGSDRVPIGIVHHDGAQFLSGTAGGNTAAEEAASVAPRVFEFSEFLVKVAKVTDVGASFPHRVTYHDACHALRELHLKQEPRELLRHVRGLELVEMPYSEECCGFGGTFSTKFPMISAAMGETKAANVEASARGVRHFDRSELPDAHRRHLCGCGNPRCGPFTSRASWRAIGRGPRHRSRAVHDDARVQRSRRRGADAMSTPAQEFLRSAAMKSADLAHRSTIRTGIDHYEAAVERTGERFLDWEAARQRMPRNQVGSGQPSRPLSARIRSAREGARRARLLGRNGRRCAALHCRIWPRRVACAPW